MNESAEETQLRQAASQCRAQFLSVGVVSICANLLMLAGLLLMLRIYDQVLTSGSKATLVDLLILVTGLFALIGVLEYIRGRVLARARRRIEGLLDGRATSAVSDPSVAAFAEGESDAAARDEPDTAVRDVDSVRRLLAGPAPFALFDLPWIPIFLAVVFFFDPLLGWIAVAGSLLLIALTVVKQFRSRGASAEAQGVPDEAEPPDEAPHRAGGAVRSAGMLANALGRWLRVWLEDVIPHRGADERTAGYWPASRALRFYLQSLMFAAGVWLVLRQEVSTGVMIAAVILFARALAPVEQAIGRWGAGRRALRGWRALGPLLKKTSHAPTSGGRLDHNFLRFVWENSKRDQLIILALTILSFPLVYLSLEIPKIIVNDAIDGSGFPRVVLGIEFDQVPYLLLLCFAFLGMVVAINGVKWVLWIAVGMCGERMLRRLRFLLFDQVLRYRISRFRNTKPGEVIQSMLAEIEPLGGFIGEVISTPAFQGGLLVVYMTFIFVQDVWLGLAAISLYPLQAIVIPILQKKVIRLNRARAGNNRVLADTIGESVGNIPEIFTNNTPRWHLAQLTNRLHTNTMIRLNLFRRKFTIKFVNNFLNQLTPFFFYSIGGYLVIVGRLDFGSLVAVLAAYKDLAGPWREVLNYIQRWTDFNARYQYVIESFTGEGVFGPERIYAEHTEPLRGDLELEGVEGGPGSGGLAVTRLKIRPGETAAVFGGGNGSRDTLLRLMAGLAEPAAGRVTMAGRPLPEVTLPELGSTLAYVGAEPGTINRSIRDNLVYGLLRRAPDLADNSTAEAMTLLREARLTGNLTADPEGDWVDYDAAGVEGPEGLDSRILRLVDRVGLADDLVGGALDSRIDPDQAERWTGPILAARAELRSTLGADELADIVEPWERGTFNSNGDLMENVLFGMPLEPAPDIRAYARTPQVTEALDAAGARRELEEIGRDIAEEFATLVETVGEDSSVLDGFPAYPKADIVAAAELVRGYHGQPLDAIKPEQRETLLVLALAFVQTRDRLDVLDESRIERLVAAQKQAHKHLEGRDDFVFFDEDRFNPGRSVAENILNAKRRHDRKAAWKMLAERMEAAIRAAGLRDDLIRLGLRSPAGSGGSNLSATARRRVALVRALLKRPQLVILDGVAAGAGETDRGLRAVVREELPEAAFVFAADDPTIKDADLKVEIDPNGNVHHEYLEAPQPCRPAADCTTGGDVP